MIKCDVVGVGFGPSNIGLAIQLSEGNNNYKSLFLEQEKTSIWHAGLLLKNADIQNNPLRDLIALVNPRSHFSFINYLHQQGTLHLFLNTGLYYPMRQDYANYIQWCSNHFDNMVKYQNHVQEITLSSDRTSLEIHTNQESYSSRAIVIASGRERNVPKVFQDIQGAQCFHACEYLHKISNLDVNKPYRFAVVGASQAAVEVILDLYQRFPNSKINSIIRSHAFKLKDTSPFSYEVYFPENIDFFYNLPRDSKELLRKELRQTNYSSVDKDVLNELYKIIYMQGVYGEQRIVRTQDAIIDQAICRDNGSVALSMHDKYTNQNQVIEADIVIFATGFKDLGRAGNNTLPLLQNIQHEYCTNPDGSIKINRDYSLEPLSPTLPKIYLSGLCETSHGLGDAGSFSLIPIRCQSILASLKQHLEQCQ